MVSTLWKQKKDCFITKGFKMGTAVQIGDEIVISNQFGSTTRKIKGRLISYQNGFLTYIPLNCDLCSMYIGI